jgi:hypothetical protein
MVCLCRLFAREWAPNAFESYFCGSKFGLLAQAQTSVTKSGAGQLILGSSGARRFPVTESVHQYEQYGAAWRRKGAPLRPPSGRTLHRAESHCSRQGAAGAPRLPSSSDRSAPISSDGVSAPIRAVRCSTATERRPAEAAVGSDTAPGRVPLQPAAKPTQYLPHPPPPAQLSRRRRHNLNYFTLQCHTTRVIKPAPYKHSCYFQKDHS